MGGGREGVEKVVEEEEERSTRFKPEWCKDGDSE